MAAAIDELDSRAGDQVSDGARDEGDPPEGGDATTQGIYLKRLSSAQPATQLTRGPRDGYDSSPDISPDGTRVAFTRLDLDRRDQPQRPASRGRRQQGVGDPHWSSGGSRLLIQSYDEPVENGGTSDEYTVKPDGSRLLALTHTGPNAVDFSGDWSPDGRDIVYIRGEQGIDHLEVRVMSATGKDESLVAACDPALFCDNPSWGTYAGPLPSIGRR